MSGATVQRVVIEPGDAQAFKRIVMHRRAAREFRPDPVPADVLNDILAATHRSPTGWNLQGWICVLVRDPARKRDLQAAAFNQRKVSEAPVVAVFAGLRDPFQNFDRVVQSSVAAGTMSEEYANRVRKEVSFMAQRGPFDLYGKAKSVLTCLLRTAIAVPSVPWSNEAYAWKHTMIAAQTFMLAASSHNLDTCGMEGFDEMRVMQVCGLSPSQYTVPVIISLGYAYESGRPYNSRLDPSTVFFDDGPAYPFPGARTLTVDDFPPSSVRLSTADVPPQGATTTAATTTTTTTTT